MTTRNARLTNRWLKTGVGILSALALFTVSQIPADAEIWDRHKSRMGTQYQPIWPHEEQAQLDAAPLNGSLASHTMTGEVVQVDQQAGSVVLKTDEGIVDLRFPPSTLLDVQRGDNVEISVALSR